MTYKTINDAATIAGNGEGMLLANRYRVVRQLGQGGMGSVWLAEDTQLDSKPFAIKMLPAILVANKRAYRQLKDEALVAMRLVHPNIVQIRAFEENNGNPFLVMDYIDGQTLDDYLAEHFPADATSPGAPRPPQCGLPEADVLRILRPIAAALDYAHGEGVVHRDVKPANVMIRKDGHPFILDFGIAREIQETMTRVTGKLSSGTLLYMSPEQLMGEQPKPAQDVYSFAAMAYECLKGEPPFVRGAIEDQIKNKQPESPPGGTQLVASVMSGLSKKPEDRPPTCIAVLEGKVLNHKELKKEKDAGVDALVATETGKSSVSRPPQADVPRHVAPIMDDPTKEWRQEPFKRVNKSRVGVVGSRVAFFAAVFVVIITCVVYFKSPRIYEAKSEFTMDMRRPQNTGGIVQTVEPDYGSTYEEVFNTRLSDWRSDKIVTKIIQQYRANYPASTVTDSELMDTLQSSELELIRHSRLITIAVRSTSAQLAASLANAYAQAIESFTDEENKLRCDKAVAQIHEQVEKQRRADEKIAKTLLEFRTANKIDNLTSEREILQQSIQKTTANILDMRAKVTAAAEWEKFLLTAQKKPEDFGALPMDVPCSAEIGTAYSKWQRAEMDMTALRARFTESHPEVRRKKGELQTIKQDFVDAVSRALATAHGNLAALRNQLEVFEKTSEKLRAEATAIEQKIVYADAGLKELEQEQTVSNEIYQHLLQKENEHRFAAEQNYEIIRVGRPAQIPSESVLPNPKVIFGFGAVLLLVIVASYVACNAFFKVTDSQ